MTTILVCTDGSDMALHAARAGLALLTQHDRVIVATVVAPPDETLLTGTSGFAGGVVTPEQFDDMHMLAQTEGDDVVRHAVEHLTAAGVTGAEPLVAFGDAATALCALASEFGAAAIVIGSRGRSGLKRAVLGSVSDHVVRNAPCPVVIVGPHDVD
jgi:nucleotide-binding universal stress UspA family protein